MKKLTCFSNKIKPLVASVFEGGGKLTVAEKLNLIINNMILTVNGVKPDENGNVQIQAGGGATVNVGTTSTLEPGSDATVTNSGTPENVILNFGIPAGATGAQGEQGPKGDTGAQGPQGETGATGAQGDPGPKGDTGERGPAGADGKAATITIGDVSTVDAGSPATVVNTGTENAAVLSFGIPKGEPGAQGEPGPKGDSGEQGPAGADGKAATITIGDVSTVDAGSPATVVNTGTENAAVLSFGIPKGEPGAQGAQGEPGPKGDSGEQGPAGADGKAATIKVGTVSTLPAGSDATVVNSGDENAAVFDFGIPMGQSGSGEVFTLLWTNPSPTSPFAGQGIQINKANYNAFLVIAKDGVAILNNYTDATSVLLGLFKFWNQTGYNMSMRSVKNYSNEIIFSDCKILDGGPLNSGVFNQHCIPYKIYGMKLE